MNPATIELGRPSLRTLLVGHGEHREFREPIRFLRDHTQLTWVPSCDNAIDLMSQHQAAPDWIVFAIPRPDVFHPTAVETICSAAPMATPIGLLGSWCEGEERTGSPLAGLLRIYWHQFVARAATMAGDARQQWAPRTASAIERSEQASLSELPRTTGRLAISAGDQPSYESLSEICELIGADSAWIEGSDFETTPAQRSFQAVIWDGPTGSELRLSALKQCAAMAGGLPVLGLMGFPREHDLARIKAAGATRVISKPFMIQDFAATVLSLLPQQRRLKAA